MTAQVGFRRQTHELRKPLHEPVEKYEIHCNGIPVQQSFELIGPGVGLRYILEGHPDFFSIAELAKGLQCSGMNDFEKALAVYRFCTRYAYVMSMGFGGYEATKFLNCHGYAFCWGQSDFQHLLYEAMGLRARAPQLKGHSSVEVLLDGRWCTLDAFTRNLHPSPDLSRLATGSDLQNHPELIEAVFPETASKLADYWSKAGPGTDTYEPWQDSRAMLLSLRRNERMRLDLDRRDVWCLAPSEPMDYSNGVWSWEPILDEEHLSTEVENVNGVEATTVGLATSGNAEVVWRIQCPYPLVDGELSLAFDKATRAEVSVSRNGRRTWTQLPVSETDNAAWHLGEEHLSVRKVASGAEPSSLEHGAVHKIFIRCNWSAVLTRMAVRFDIQAHGRSLPRMKKGENRWSLIGGGQGTTAIHSYTVNPGLVVSNSSPLEDETITLQAEVSNWGDQPARDVTVSFQQAGTSEILGETILEHIPAGGSAIASIEWKAKAIGDRPRQNEPDVFRYVETAIEAKIAAGCAENDEYSLTAETRITVRPRPVPRITKYTFHVERDDEDEKLRLRAALSNMPHECITGGSHVYISDSPLSATLSLWNGHPDQGGTPLGEDRTLDGILPAEFAVADWTFLAAEIPDSVELWLEVKCGEEVREEDRRVLLILDV